MGTSPKNNAMHDASVSWWAKVDQANAQVALNKIQRIPCLCVTRVINVPEAALL